MSSWRTIRLIATFLALLAVPISAQTQNLIDELRNSITTLNPIHSQLKAPGADDWLAHHEEDGQTFEQFLRFHRGRNIFENRVIYILPIGDFTDTEASIISNTSEFLNVYFGLKTIVRPSIAEDIIPPRARRVHTASGKPQILTRYVLEQILLPEMPKNAACFVALTKTDLWPGEDWNFVYGESNIADRVGIWSTNRFGDPHSSKKNFDLYQLRTLKTASHEVGHMLGMDHCIAFECNLCGSNNDQEADRLPLALCPECMAKAAWVANTDPATRHRGLVSYCKKMGLIREARFYQRSVDLLTRNRR